MIPQPDNFEVKYGKWLLVGSPEKGWFAWCNEVLLQPKGLPGAQLALGVHAKGPTRTLVEAAGLLHDEAKKLGVVREKLGVAADPDWEKMAIALDVLLENGWKGAAAGKKDAAAEKLPEFHSSEFEWVPNPAQNCWTLFFGEHGVFQVTSAEVYNRSPTEVQELVIQRLGKSRLPPSVRERMNQAIADAFRNMAYPGPLNPYGGSCPDCGGGGFIPDFGSEYAAVRCGRCNGTGVGAG